MTTHLHLVTNPRTVVVERDGQLFFRGRDRSDEPIRTSQTLDDWILAARIKYGLSRALGVEGEEAPIIPEGIHIPRLRSEFLPSGELVYRIATAEALSDEEIDEREELRRADAPIAPCAMHEPAA